MYLYLKLNSEARGKLAVPGDVWTCFLPAENKDCITSALSEYRNMSARKDTIFTHKNSNSPLENLFREENEKVVH